MRGQIFSFCFIFPDGQTTSGIGHMFIRVSNQYAECEKRPWLHSTDDRDKEMKIILGIFGSSEFCM